MLLCIYYRTSIHEFVDLLFESLRCSISRFITTKLGKLGRSYEALLLCLVGHLYLRFNYVPMKKMNLRSLCRRRRTVEDHLGERRTAKDHSMAYECPWTTQGSLQRVKAVRKSVVVKWWEPDGMNDPQTQTPNEGLSGMATRALAREEPLRQLDQPLTSMRETPRTAPQFIHQPLSAAPVGTNNWRTIEDTLDWAIPREVGRQQNGQRDQVVEDPQLEAEDVQPQVEREHQGNGNNDAPEERVDRVEVPASPQITRSPRAGNGTTTNLPTPRQREMSPADNERWTVVTPRRSSRFGRGTTKKFDDYVRLKD